MLHIYASVLGVFICVLQVFHLDVVYVCNGYTRVFKFFSGVFCKCFRCMLQVFQLIWTS
jgi:hypothetical protein